MLRDLDPQGESRVKMPLWAKKQHILNGTVLGTQFQNGSLKRDLWVTLMDPWLVLGVRWLDRWSHNGAVVVVLWSYLKAYLGWA